MSSSAVTRLAAVALLLVACDAADGEGTTPSTAVATTATSTVPPGVTEPPDETDELIRRLAAGLPTARTEVAGALWEGGIVVVGGLDAGGRAAAAVDLYDPAADAWAAGPELPEPLHHTAVAVLGDRVYVVGGYAVEGGRWVPRADVWSLGPGDDEWRAEPSLASARGALAVASTGDRLVAIGGVPVLTSTEILHAGADSWVAGPDLRIEREHLAATAVGDDVYAIAGRAGDFGSNRSSVEVLRGGEWELVADLNFARGGIGAATVGDTPCVTGGEEDAGTIGSVECLIDGQWLVIAHLDVARHGLVAAAIGADLHVIGGGPRPGLTASGIHEVIPIVLP